LLDKLDDASVALRLSSDEPSSIVKEVFGGQLKSQVFLLILTTNWISIVLTLPMIIKCDIDLNLFYLLSCIVQSAIIVQTDWNPSLTLAWRLTRWTLSWIH
jgi:hypothetical protein